MIIFHNLIYKYGSDDSLVKYYKIRVETNSDADFEEEEDEEPEFSGKQVLPVLFKPWNDHLE